MYSYRHFEQQYLQGNKNLTLTNKKGGALVLTNLTLSRRLFSK